MLNINPSRRISATDALKHPWICVSYLKRKREMKRIAIYLISSSKDTFMAYLPILFAQ